MISLMAALRFRFWTRGMFALIAMGFLGVSSVQGQTSATKLKVAAVQFRSSF